MTNNRIHFKYLFKGREFLSDVRNTKPDWGLPELIMPSFEKVMEKSAKSFFNIDHQLFQEFYNDNVCGILIEKEATIIYGFGEDTLYVWLFKEEIEKSTLLLYFYVKSSTDNKRQIYTCPTLINDDQLFCGNKEKRKQIYEELANKLIIYLAVKKYVQVEKVIIPLGTSTLIDDTIKDYRKKESERNADEDDQKIEVGAMQDVVRRLHHEQDSLAKQGSDDGQHNGNDEGNPKTVGYVTPQVAV